MPNGGVLIVETNTSRERGFLKITFTDNGLGISEDVKPHIFDPFYTTKSQGKGTGLGLFVSLGIIRKHGGDIQVESQINQGTTFTVLLPVASTSA